jgi:hypothetical protein
MRRSSRRQFFSSQALLIQLECIDFSTLVEFYYVENDT